MTRGKPVVAAAARTKKSKVLFTFGEVWQNPYLGCKFTEVLNTEKKRIGFIWTHTDGRIVVMPSLRFYIWYDEEGDEWDSVEKGAQWLLSSSTV